LAWSFILLGLGLPARIWAQGALPISWIYDPTTIPETIAYSPSGTSLAVAGPGGGVLLYGVNGQLIRSFVTAASAQVYSIAFSPDGNTLAVGGQSINTADNVRAGVLETINVSTGASVHEFKTAATTSVHSVAFSPDGKTLASGGSGATGVLELWTWATATKVKTLPTANNGVLSVAFSWDGGILAAGGYGPLELWTVATGNPLRTLNTASKVVYGVAFSPDKVRIATCGGNESGGQLELWNYPNNELIKALDKNVVLSIGQVAFSPDGKTLADSAGSLLNSEDEPESTLELWNVQSQSKIPLSPIGIYGGSAVAFNPNPKSLTFAVGGDAPISGVGYFGSITIWDDTGFQTLPEWLTFGSVTWSAMSADGTKVATGGSSVINGTGDTESVQSLWSVASGKPTPMVVPEFAYPTSSGCFSPDGKTLAVGGPSDRIVATAGLIQLIGLGQGAGTTNLAANIQPTSLVYSPDGKSLADCTDLDAGSNYKTIEVWNVGNAARTWSLTSKIGEGINCLAFSPDGNYLADAGQTGEDANEVEVWNLSTGRIYKTFSTSAFDVLSVAFSPDGKTLTAGGWNADSAVLESWNVASGAPVAAPLLPGGTATVNAVAYTPNSGILYVAVGSRFLAYSTFNNSLLSMYGSLASKVTSISQSANGYVMALTRGQTLEVAYNPFFNQLAKISLSPSSVNGGTSSTVTVTLEKPALVGGAKVLLSSNSPSASVTGSILIPAGQTTGAATVTTKAVNSATSVVITGTFEGTTSSASLTIRP
jgi:WD40 repeat protein